MFQEAILRSFQGKGVLITGGTGLIGRQVADILIEAGAHTKIVSLDRIKINEKADSIIGDITNFDFCKEITRDMDFVFHLAGIKGSIEVSRLKPATHFVPTLMMNTNMLEACRMNKVSKAVYTSSIGAYAQAEVFKEADYRISSEPMDFAGWAKRMGELQVCAYKVQYGMENFAMVRLSNVYGPGDNFDPDNAMVIPSLMSRIYTKEDPVIIWGDGTAQRDFVYSRDVACGIILALYHGTRAGFVNLGSGSGCAIKEVVEALRGFIEFNYIFDTSKPSGPSRKIMDITLAREMLGYNPTTSLLNGLRQTWEWFIHHHGEYLEKKNYFKG